MPRLRSNLHFVFLAVAALCPLLDTLLPEQLRFADALRPIFIFALLGLGLNVVTGFTGLLNLGAAGFMAIGGYSYAIATCDIYPFQLGFFGALLMSALTGMTAGILLGLPTLRLRGDYLAIATLGFGEIVQSIIRNLDVITKGTQGINPIPAPILFGYVFQPENYLPWYYLFWSILTVAVVVVSNLERSSVGRRWISVREDELASACMGTDVVRAKMSAFIVGAILCSIAGALWVSYLGSTGEPGNYDFQISIIALCMVIVGGLGSIPGVLLGALVMIGFNSILLTKIAAWINSLSTVSSTNVLASPNNWKYLIFGLALVVMMRFKPEGLLPAGRHYHRRGK
ncbi:MAG: branched-chain amino acid ABC transporter permease [Oligoflexia bacterium]|nr:branched-chain amino acid ABC transporter permease [Oligoflexia bacterium]